MLKCGLVVGMLMWRIQESFGRGRESRMVLQASFHARAKTEGPWKKRIRDVSNACEWMY